jgi:hypothetical protein
MLNDPPVRMLWVSGQLSRLSLARFRENGHRATPQFSDLSNCRSLRIIAIPATITTPPPIQV